MKYCPECRGEFQDWVEKCPDCGAALTDTIPPEQEEVFREGNLVQIASAPNEIEAQLWKGILEDEGIHSMVRVNEGSNLYVSPMALMHEIYVLEADEDRARQILDEIEDAPFEGEV